MYQHTLLIAIEGVDGAGKSTLTTKVAAQLEEAGVALGRMAYPRYGTRHADLSAAALRGDMGDLVDSPYAMATLFALDRKESLTVGEGLSHIIATLAEEAPHQPRVVILDRWVASNAAYSAGRLEEQADQIGGVVEWVGNLEFGTFELPIPDLTILLDVPVELARERAASREAADITRTRDAYERDVHLQNRTAQVYRQLAQQQWKGRWIVVSDDVNPVDIAHEIVQLISV